MAERNLFLVGKNKISQTIKQTQSMVMHMPISAIYFRRVASDEILCVNDRMLSMLGCNKEEFDSRYEENFFSIFAKEDRQTIESALENCISSANDADIECRIINVAGEIIWCRLKLQIIRDNEEISVLASLFNINTYKKQQESMDEERRQYRKIINMNSNISFEYDIVDDTISFSNSDEDIKLAGQKIPNFSKRLFATKKVYEADKAKILALRSLEGSQNVDYRYISMDDKHIWCQINAVAIDDEVNYKKMIIGCINNIDKAKKEEEKTIEKAKQDVLTRLLNRSNTKNEIVEYLAGEGKSGVHGFMIMDIDNFERINEKQGSMFGDAVLINIADNLKNLFYKSDVVGRIGGDELLIFIKNVAGRELLAEKAKEISQIVKNTYIGENDDITCSMGITIYPKDGRDYDNLFRNADRALHKAKIDGKNRYEFYVKEEMELFPTAGDTLFNNYKIENHVKKGADIFDREITTFAFDIMSRTKDVNSAIKLILDKVGKQFDASFVSIYEYVENSNKVVTTYCWCKDGTQKRVNEEIDMPVDKYDKYTAYFADSSVLTVPDVKRLTDGYVLKEHVQNIGVKAFIQCPIYENAKIVGVISLADSQKARKWSKYERDSLVTISKVIASYLLKMRASQQMEERLKLIKNYDSLTGLATLHKFKKQVTSHIQENPDKMFLIVNTDIDKFKYINDTIGYESGDEILKQFAEFLKGDGMMNIYSCRNSADNFLTLFEVTDEQTIIDRIELMSQLFADKVREKYVNINLTMSSGVCVIDDDASDLMITIDNANIARKYAKGSNESKCIFFNDEMRNKIKVEFEIISNMEKALLQNEFKVYLQPKVSLENGTMVGAEALVRWIKPDGTIMPPDKFIPLFEKNGFVVNVDFYVYEEVCKMISEWQSKGIRLVPISVNVSRIHLYDSCFVDNFVNLINRYNVPFEMIELELTESIFLDNTEVAISTMRRFRNIGFKVSIDDFGAGYSSLNLLKEMTSDVLKLDKEFFGKGELQKEEQIIVSSIVNMAKQLNMKVLSEGVETTSQSHFLKEIACDMAQGYLFARPMPKESFEVIMANNLKFGLE